MLMPSFQFPVHIFLDTQDPQSAKPGESKLPPLCIAKIALLIASKYHTDAHTLFVRHLLYIFLQATDQ